METITTLIDPAALAEVEGLKAALADALELAERLDIALRRLAIPVVVTPPTQMERFQKFYKKLLNGEKPHITGWALTEQQYETIVRHCPEDTKDRAQYLEYLKNRVNLIQV